MQASRFRCQVLNLLACLALVSGNAAWADPPSRVARLGYVGGVVSLSPAGERDWNPATLNRPLTPGDRLWTDASGRAEIAVGGAMFRVSADTGLSVLNLDDRIVQLQLTQGSLNLRVRRLQAGEVIEIDTPNLALTVKQPGNFRIDVNPDADATTVLVRQGQAEVAGEGDAWVMDTRQAYRFRGTGLRDVQAVDAAPHDDFDRWAGARDRALDNAASARYVSPDVLGYQDLDANGRWQTDARYGPVWVPTHVAADWAPYRDGHWAWIDPWGWTWVDDAPWGFAVSHYGRWAHLGTRWGWVPGPAHVRAYYAPALVMFVGGEHFQLAISAGNVGGVAWFPLGPRDVFRPAYPVSRGYFDQINRSNTVINNTVIHNTYNTNVSQIVYVNRQVPGAVVAVPAPVFVQSRPVGRAVVPVRQEQTRIGPVAPAPLLAPTPRSVHGAATDGSPPPDHVFERPVLARTAPPAPHAGFSAQQPQLAARPGRPLADAERRGLKPETTAPAPFIKLITPRGVAPPALPPRAEPPHAEPPRAVAPPRAEPPSRAVPMPLPNSATPQGPAAAPAAPPQPTPPPTPHGRPGQPEQAVQRPSPGMPAEPTRPDRPGRPGAQVRPDTPQNPLPAVPLVVPPVARPAVPPVLHPVAPPVAQPAPPPQAPPVGPAPVVRHPPAVQQLPPAAVPPEAQPPRARPQPLPPTRQTEPRPPPPEPQAAAQSARPAQAAPPPQVAHPPQAAQPAKPAPQAAPHGPEPRPAATPPADRRRDADEPPKDPREDDRRRQRP